MKAYTFNPTELEVWKLRNGKSDEDLARMLRVTPATISRWRRGHNAIPLAAALEIERITGIPLRTLFVEADIQAPKSASDRTADGLIERANLPGAKSKRTGAKSA